MTHLTITIVGAGIGGVTLGRCLLKRGISSVLYERRSSSRGHSYGITLHPSSYRPLLKVLDTDEKNFRRRIAVDSTVGGTGAIDPTLLIQPGETSSSSFRAHRGKLEKLLGNGLDIRWESPLEKLQQDTSGTTLYLQNGQILQQEYVVGVDGPHANTRRSLTPTTDLEVLPYVAFNGKRRVEKELFNTLYATGMKKSAIVEKKHNGVMLHVSVNEDSGDIVNINWIYSRVAHGLDDPLYKPSRSAAEAADIPEGFYQEVAALPADLGQPFEEVFDERKLRMDKTLSWLMRSVDMKLPELQRLAAKGAFFIGDSIHAEPILGGEGANVAITDAVRLADQIADHGSGSIADWYNEQYIRWTESQARSKKTIEKMHEHHQSFL